MRKKSGFQEMRMKSRADGARADLGSRHLCVCESRGESWQQELREYRGWAMSGILNATKMTQETRAPASQSIALKKEAILLQCKAG